MNTISTLWRIHTPFLFFMGFCLLVGLWIYRDFGLSHDEVTQRTTGAMAAVYANQKLGYVFLSEEAIRKRAEKIVEDPRSIDKYLGKTGFNEYRDRDYGVVFELFLIGAEVVSGVKDSADVYFLRHLLTYLFFLVGLAFFYFLLWEWLQNRWWALMGAVFLYLSPPIFAHAFFNSKDIPFMVAYLGSMYTLQRLLRNKTFANAVWHALMCAIAVDIRIPGIFMPGMTGLMVGLEFLKAHSPMGYLKQHVRIYATYVIMLGAMIVLFWPFLWEAPFKNFLFAFANMSKFRWNGQTFALGQVFEPYLYTPWYYIPIWIIATTPLLYVLAFFYALFLAIQRAIKVPDGQWLYDTPARQTLLMCIGASILPLTAVIVLGSTVYDGWRQLYFIYPGILASAVYAMHHLFEQVRSRPLVWTMALTALLSATVVTTAFRMVKLHPFQHLYFSNVVGDNPGRYFDLDYWGTSYRKLLENMVSSSKEELQQRPLVVWADEFSAKVNLQGLPAEVRKNFRFADSLHQADYYLTIFRSRLPDGFFALPDSLINRNTPVAEVWVDGRIRTAAAFKVNKR